MRNDDVALIQRTLAGEENAFASLVRKYQRQVHAFARRKIGDFQIAEDITQETFLQVYQKLETLDDPTLFSQWLYTIANHLCIAWFRKNQLQTEPLEDVRILRIETEPYSRYVASEHAKIAAEAQRDLVAKLLAKLKESDRKVITLHYFEEMTSSEIGEFLGVSENTIKSRIRRARQHLKKYESIIREVLGIAVGAEDRYTKDLNGGIRMKLTFDRDNLLSSLQALQSIVSQRNNTEPILSNVLIQAEGNTIACMATDAEIGIRMKVDGTVKETGSILVSAEKLADIVKTWPAEKLINFATTTDDHVEITCGDSVRKIVGFPDKTFPQFPVVDTAAFTIDGETLRSVLHKTEFAAPTKKARQTCLNGLYFNLLEDRTEVVGADGIQLALAHCEPLKLSEDKDGFIVPLKAVKEIERAFANAPEIKISLIEDQILFADADTTLTTRLVDAKYPEYDRIIPESFEGHVVVPKASIMDTTREIFSRANPKNALVCLEIDPQQIRISAKTSETDEIDGTLAAESGTGSVRMGLNAQLLIETLSHIETESVSLAFTNAMKPLVVKPIGEEGHICVLCTMLMDS
ncbi:DNA polymerase III subunit beta [Candidatus Poribacteria bacterium]|nr:DNA polymerase III subunit beta [Candidatus Poribacteria bacterium]MYA98959.1 DNA polymerase III subunit beta [Candidatus Poribacteria bacterium]